MEVIQILEKLVAFNTINDKENKGIIEYIKVYLEQKGFECRKVVDKKTSKACLIANLGECPHYWI